MSTILKISLLLLFLTPAFKANAQPLHNTDSLQSHRDTVPAKYVGIKKRSPFIACALSLYTPGVGQFYNRQYTKGSIILGGIGLNVLGIAIAGKYPETPYQGDYRIPYRGALFVLLAGGLWVYAIADAPLSATNINTRYHLVNRQNKTFSHLQLSPILINADYAFNKPVLGFKLSLK